MNGAILRVSTTAMAGEHRVLRFGVFELDIDARELRKQGRRVRLQDKPFELLLHLLEHPGETVTRDDLQQRLWPSDTFVAFDDNLNAAVRKVRDALGDSADNPRFVETLPRRGYRFIAPVSEGRSAPASDLRLPTPAIPARDQGRARTRRAGVMLGALGLAVLVLTAALFAPRRALPSPIRFQVAPPPGAAFPSKAPAGVVSPDGEYLAFVAELPADRVGRLWVQPLDSSAPRVIMGTDHGNVPTWSPDSRSIAYVSSGGLRIVDLSNGQIRDICPASSASGMTWNDRGELLVPNDGVLTLVPAVGGAPRQVTRLDASLGERRHDFPQFLPDGRRFLYFAQSTNPENSGVYLASLDGGQSRRILATQHKALFMPPANLFFVRDGALMLSAFDQDSGRVSGEAQPVAEDIATVDVTGAAEFSVSRAGTLVYTSRPRYPLRQLVWFDRGGRRLGTVGSPNHNVGFSLSSDERSAVLERPDAALQAPNLWVLSIDRGVETRATRHRGNTEGPVWSPDSRHFVYARHRDIHQVADLYVANRDLPGEDQPLLADGVSAHPNAWSPDGRYIFFERPDPYGTSDLWVVRVGEGANPYAWLQTRFMERHAQFSPDGRWVAYVSDASGRSEVYVRAFASSGTEVQISTNGGARPRWGSNGRELFYLSADYQMMAAGVRLGRSFQSGAPLPLFELNHLIAGPFTEAAFAVSSDSQRFLVNVSVEEPGDPPMTVVLNAANHRAPRY